MYAPTATILHRTTSNRPLNILCMDTHERYQTGMALTGHNFYSFQAKGHKQWNSTYAPVPKNYTILDGNRDIEQIPPYIQFDAVLSQNKFAHFTAMKKISNKLHCPLISLEHCLPVELKQHEIELLKTMSGDINVFITDFSRKQWGYDEKDSEVIYHGVDTETFCPNSLERQNVLLSVVNDWKNRDAACGFKLWTEVSRGLPVKVLGDTPGISKAAKDVNELVNVYQTSTIFLNTSLKSPIPTVLLEAASCGCAIVSTSNCMIPEIFTHEENALLSNNPNTLREYCNLLLKDEKLREKLSNNARDLILNKYNMKQFTQNWNLIFEKASNIPFRGI